MSPGQRVIYFAIIPATNKDIGNNTVEAVGTFSGSNPASSTHVNPVEDALLNMLPGEGGRSR